jgi:hypothetical protein
MQATDMSRHAYSRRHGRSREDGAQAVEFALVLPILLLVLFGIITFGIIFAQQLALGNATRQAARFGVVGERTCGQIVAEAQANAVTLAMPSPSEDVDITVNREGIPCSSDSMVPCAGSDPGDNVEVKASFVSAPLVPLLGDVTLDSTGVFRCEFS